MWTSTERSDSANPAGPAPALTRYVGLNAGGEARHGWTYRSDLERSVRFYRAIALPFPDGAEGSEHGHAEVDVGGGFRLTLDAETSIASFDASWKPAEGGDQRRSCAQVPNRRRR
jgi:hypothetical protein